MLRVCCPLMQSWLAFGVALSTLLGAWTVVDLLHVVPFFYEVIIAALISGASMIFFAKLDLGFGKLHLLKSCSRC